MKCTTPSLFPGRNHKTTTIIHSRRRRHLPSVVDSNSWLIQRPVPVSGHTTLSHMLLADHLQPKKDDRSELSNLSEESQTDLMEVKLLRVKRVEPIKVVQLGFIMDGVLSVRNLSGAQGLDFHLKYYPNPRVYNFSEPNNIKVFKGEMIIIEVCGSFIPLFDF